MKSKLKLAIVGVGTWGENHIKIYQSHPFAEVVAICDRDYAKARGVADRYSISGIYDDYNRMFKESNCDAVAIVTPDFAHADIAISAANNKKHMLIEKPLATTEKILGIW